MFASDPNYDIDQELAAIPPEYQEVFRQTIARELAETEQNRTDTDILAYLRQRRDHFRNGGFIRPDGRPGLVALGPEALYEQALPQLARDSLGEAASATERRQTVIKMVLFAGAVLLFLVLALRGRAQREDVAVIAVENTAAAGTGTAVPTSPLPEITGVEESLQTIGSLGGALTIGRPGAVEIRYGRTGETIALAIDPSKPTPKGELRYNETTMLSDNPVAVWLFGTVLNYALGIPDSLVRNLETGDRITLSTDTGAALHFVVVETGQGASYDTGRLLSQTRLGLTLFALPAAADEDVAYAVASYDVASEEGQAAAGHAPGDRVTMGNGQWLRVTGSPTTHTADGLIRIVVTGETNIQDTGQTILLSLTTSQAQTTAVPLTWEAAGRWQAVIDLPAAAAGQGVSAEFRPLPGSHVSVVELGTVPDLLAQLEIGVTRAWWDGEKGQAVLEAAIGNPGEGAVFLPPEFIQIVTEGGDAYEEAWQVTPRLPLLVNPGETTGITVSFLPHSASVRLQIGTALWQVDGFPTGNGTE